MQTIRLSGVIERMAVSDDGDVIDFDLDVIGSKAIGVVRCRFRRPHAVDLAPVLTEGTDVTVEGVPRDGILEVKIAVTGDGNVIGFDLDFPPASHGAPS